MSPKSIYTVMILWSFLPFAVAAAEPDGGTPAAAAKDPAHDARPGVVVAIGTIEPETVAEVPAVVAGTVTSLNVDFRSEVEKGAILARIDDAPFRIELVEARAKLEQSTARLSVTKARLALARISLDRMTANKAAAGAESEIAFAKATVDEAEAAVLEANADIDLAKAEVEHAEMNLAGTSVRSPMKGVVVDRRINLGQIVGAGPTGEGIFLVADLTHMQIWLSVPEQDVTRIRPAQTVQFKVRGFPNAAFSGTVKQVRLNALKTGPNVAYTVIVAIDNSNIQLLPYLTAEAEINIGDTDDVKK